MKTALTVTVALLVLFAGAGCGQSEVLSLERGFVPIPKASPQESVEVALVDPDVLERLEARGFSLGKLVADTDAATTWDLARTPRFESVFETLTRDVGFAVLATRPQPRVTSVDGFRAFDQGWFRSKEMSFVLTGVFNRMDRRTFHDDACGEIRFVYRLRYQTQKRRHPMQGRLPMTVNVVFSLKKSNDCQDIARGWQAPDHASPSELAAWFVSKGALRSDARASWQLHAVETNVQTVRVQSSVQPSMGGTSEYDLRVFRPNGKTLLPSPMENTPDVAKLARDEALRAELLRYLRKPEVLARIDRGTLRLPERFLATSAKSFSPRELTRPANRPFSKLFDASDFADLELDAFSTIRSTAALLRRLDAATCPGCHQSHSIAGFHHVGVDRWVAHSEGRLQTGMSNHLQGELERRRDYVAAIANGVAPDETRPMPERQGMGQAYAAPCGLGDPGFSQWTCAKGFRCQRLEDPFVGMCMPESDSDSGIGAPCEYGTGVSSGRTPTEDGATELERVACKGSLSCDLNVSGFPLGSCSDGCGTAIDGGTCGKFLNIDYFQGCLRAGRSRDECVNKWVFETELRACDTDHACRPGYVCAQTPDPKVGACVPPYFVFQLRLDGYPLER